MKRLRAPIVAGFALIAWAACKDEGVVYLTSVNDEAPGTNCTDGGSKLNFGADGDADGTLTAEEVTASAFVCNGAASRGATVTSSPLGADDNDCPAGGYMLTIGVDRDGNGAVEGEEGVTRKICNGTGMAGPGGDNGPAGDAGVTGPQGEQGPFGATGAQGDVGATGPQGALGATGPQGNEGPTGPQGEDGDEGPTGPQGEDGDEGPTGPQGDIGPAGPQGDAGVTGPQGDQGVQGVTGPQGDQGVTGPQGDQGIQGVTGPQGDQGIQGVTGPQGDQGVQGVTGPQGDQGVQGVTGPQGDQGDQGVTGPQGDQGVQGVTGPQGDQGVQGVTGPQGDQGVTGPQGNNGFNSLFLVTAEPIGANCSEAGLRIDVGLDNGDGVLSTAGDGTLQSGEIDQTSFLCTPAITFANGDFETGDFTGWLTQDLPPSFLSPLTVSAASPLEGAFTAVSPFDGDGGSGHDSIFLAQDIDLTGFSTVSVSFDWDVSFCSNFGTLDRVFSLIVEPSGGGVPLFTSDIFTCAADGDPHSAVPVDDQTIDISSAAGQPVRIKFRWLVPESLTGGAEGRLDDVKLLFGP